MPVLVLLFLLFFCDRKYRPYGRYYRWPLPRLLPKTTSAYKKSLLFRAEVAPEVTTEVPVYRYYRSPWRNYRWHVPEQLPASTSAYEISVLLPSGSGTGTCPGTTAMTGTTGPFSGSTGVQCRAHFRGLLPPKFFSTGLSTF